MNKLTQYLTEPFLIEEGVKDPGILKAVFLAGGRDHRREGARVVAALPMNEPLRK